MKNNLLLRLIDYSLILNKTMMKIRLKNYDTYWLVLFSAILIGGCVGSGKLQQSSSEYSWIDLDTIKAGSFDTGKMWTFEYPPLEYFKEEYDFTPSQEWFDDVRLSALRFATYCSASFVSEDGLIMTNDHCARESVVEVQQEGEDLNETGFFAETLEDERPVPGLFVDQLVLIKDVTEEVQLAVDKAVTDEEKITNEEEIISEIEGRESEATGLTVSVIPLYFGGKYSLYGYKRYNDVRLVFIPESQLGFFGGDPDNFTYPRYNLDCSFFRVYNEDGKPLKTDNFFKWSENGAIEDEVVFTIGNPGSTSRLNTVAQLEFYRDVLYPGTLDLLGTLVSIYAKLMEENPDGADELEVQMLKYSNSYKAYAGMLDGLREPVLIQKKRDFEKKFKKAVQSDAELNSKYGSLWEKLDKNRGEFKEFYDELYLLSFSPIKTSQYFYIAQDLINLAEELKLPEDQRSDIYKGEELQSTINSLFPEDFDYTYNNELLQMQLDMMSRSLGKEYPLLKKMTDGHTGEDAVKYILEKSSVSDSEKVKALAVKDPDAILNSDDPFIYFILNSAQRKYELQMKALVLIEEEEICTKSLGRALYEVYGTSIPPDATFTLRISDGVIKGFPYNGTIAPSITTYYGMYDRFYSFQKEFPWSLPERWLNPPPEFDLETPFNFVATNDVIGGNSGSPVINKEGEIVGLAFDGNIQSLPGSFIYTTEENRMVAVHSEGMIEAIRDLYKATRLGDELTRGKLASE
jgi:hypothetical protein